MAGRTSRPGFHWIQLQAPTQTWREVHMQAAARGMKFEPFILEVLALAGRGRLDLSTLPEPVALVTPVEHNS